MNKLLSEKNAHTSLIAALALCLVVCIILFIYIGGFSGTDVIGHWRICKYTLEGYNPYSLIGADAPIESVGPISKGFSTVPWSCLFGSAFYGGFLPLNWACVYILSLHFIALALLIAVLYRKFKDTLSRGQLLALLMLPCVHFSFMYSVHFGNAGGVICCLLIVAFCITEKHPIAAGILLGLAMMKPQITAIICLIYLFQKQWKPLAIAAAIVIAGWIATSLITATSPLQLLAQTFSSGTAAPTQYLGLLNNLKYFGVNSTFILLFNMLIGAAYTTFLFFYIKKRNTKTFKSLFIYIPGCIASVFWIFKNGTDYLILTFAAIFFALLMMKKTMSMKDRLGSLLSIGYLEMGRCAVYLGISLFPKNLFVRDLFKSADGLVIGLIGIYLCYLWTKYDADTVMNTKQ